MRLRFTLQHRVLYAMGLALTAQALLSAPAFAQDSPEETGAQDLGTDESFPRDWLIAEGTDDSCDLARARSRIIKLLEQKKTDGAPLTPQVTLQGDSSGINGEANLTQRDQVVFHKTVTAQSCADVLEALIFSLEIEMERRATQSKPEAPPQDDRKPPNDPYYLPEESPKDPETGPEQWTPMILVGLLSSAGDLPTGATGSLGGAVLARIPVADRWYLTGEGRHSQVQPSSRGDIDYLFTKIGFHLGPGLARRVSPGVVLRFDSSLVLHLLRIAVDSPVTRSETALMPSLGAALHGALSICPWRSLVVEARGGAGGIFLRGRYLDNEGDVIWQEPWGSLNAGLLIGWGGNPVKSAKE